MLTADERFLNALWITLYFTVASLMLELVLAMIMALVLNRTIRGLGVIRTLFLLPLVATPTATSVIWLIMMEPSIRHILNYFLEAVGLPPSLWVAGENFRGPQPCLDQYVARRPVRDADPAGGAALAADGAVRGGAHRRGEQDPGVFFR